MAIDYKKFESYLEARKNKKVFVTKDDFITNEDVISIRKLVKDFGKTEVYNCIRTKSTNGKVYKFKTELICSKCSAKMVENIGRTEFLSYIEKNEKLCSKCISIVEEQEKQDTIDCDKLRSENTKAYIHNYLNIDRCWNESTKLYEKINMLKFKNIEIDKIIDYINSLPYKDFLVTPYWKAIAQYKRYKAKYKCELCNSNGSLAVHHKTYENHGLEVYHLEDLVVLCKDCHEKFHGIVRS
jgi:5-methylcytosine-specific restriction endonuclease McrA